ncbi:hypothetical protein R1X32_06960 (plasmid) [Rhodococcus opacus]|uniref:hypothetical protein n=1 Tax=Rhodococcus opacus TaxID=37919 RepID=UPI0034D1F452
MTNAYAAQHSSNCRSDYPHWNYTDPTNALAGLPEDLQCRIMFDNPREFYGDRIN